jgi:hypothetical protein
MIPAREKTRWRAIEAVLGALLLVGGAAGYTLLLQSQIATHTTTIRDFIGEREINGAGAWTIESFDVGSERVDASGMRLSFDFDRHCLVEYAGEVDREQARREQRRQCTYVADRAKHTFELHGPKTTTLPLDEMSGTYELTEGGLILKSTSDGKPVRVVLRPWTWPPPTPPTPRASASGSGNAASESGR